MKNKALVTVAAVLLLGCARQVPYANQQSEILQFVEGSFPYKIELCESSEEAYDAIAFKIKNYPTKDCNLLAEDLMNSIEFTKAQIKQQKAIVDGLKLSGDKSKLIEGIEANVKQYEQGLQNLERQLQTTRQ